MTFGARRSLVRARRISGALYLTGNRWIQAAIIILLVCPAATILASLSGNRTLTAVVALAPLAAGVFVAIASVDPLLVAALVAIPGIRNPVRWLLGRLAGLVALELAVGVYFTLTPVANDPGLIIVLVLVSTAIAFFATYKMSLAAGGVMARTVGKAIAILVVITIILTVIFFLGGRDGVSRRSSVTGAPAARAAAPVGEETVSWPDSETLIVVEPREGTCIGVQIPLDTTWYRVDPLSDTPTWIKTWDGKRSKPAIRGQKGVVLPIRNRNRIDEATFWVCNAKAQVTINRG